MPKVTVGMPAYNRGEVIGNSIKSVLNQSYKDFELIIYDDGSEDNTPEVCRSFNDSRISYIRKDNLGPPYPLNYILSRASGNYIIILHDHDFFERELIHKCVEALDSYPEAGFVMPGSAWVNEDGKSNFRTMLHDWPLYNKGRNYGKDILENRKNFSSPFHACSMVRKKAYDRVGKYNLDYGLYADVDMWLRLLFEFDFLYLDEVLITFRERETSGHFLSDKQFKILEWKYQINKANISRYYIDDELEKKMKRLCTKKKRFEYMLLIKSILYQDRSNITNGHQLNKICRFQSATVSFCLEMMQEYPEISKILYSIGFLINKLRGK